ncbi:hypothetical protein Tco_0982211, partial [Tanacetum coccineum]
FKGVDFRRWQKKMNFLLSTMRVVYVLNTLTPNDEDDATVEQIRRRNKWKNDDYDSLEAKYMAEDASSKKFLKDFKHTLKHKKQELTLVELGIHLCIWESLRMQDNDKPKGNNVVGPSVVNMVEHNNSIRYGRKEHFILPRGRISTVGYEVSTASFILSTAYEYLVSAAAYPDLWIVVLRIGKLQRIGEFSVQTASEQTATGLAIPGQTTTGKESSNPFMAGSLPKTIHFCDSLKSDEDSFKLIELMILCTNFLTMVRDLENLKTTYLIMKKVWVRMHPNMGGLMMQMQRLPSLMRLQMMLETRTTRFQTAIRSEEVFGYILLMIKKLTQKKLDVNKVNIKFRGGLLGIFHSRNLMINKMNIKFRGGFLGIKDSLMLFE